MKYLKIIFGIVLTLLSLGMIIRLIGYPNQLIFFLSGLLFIIFVIIPTSFRYSIRKANSPKQKMLIVFIALMTIIAFLVAPVIIMDPTLMIILIFVLTVLVHIAYAYSYFQRSKERSILTLDILIISSIGLTMLNAPIKPQTPDKLFVPIVKFPEYPKSKGPIVYLDEGHHNIHKLDGLYWAFGELLRADGYQTEPYTGPFEESKLKEIKILVIANAINSRNENNWNNPTYSAFTTEEVAALEDWVANGGSLFLIADHMPFPGASASLAEQFGFQFKNGFAMDTLDKKDLFVRSSNSLEENILTQGNHPTEKVDSILTFTGQAFTFSDSSAFSILTFGNEYLQWEPDQAWDLNSVEPYPVSGFSQGAFREYGKGKVVVFGEAMMFTAQLGWGFSWVKLGFTNRLAKGNQQLLLNIIHWLDKND